MTVIVQIVTVTQVAAKVAIVIVGAQKVTIAVAAAIVVVEAVVAQNERVVTVSGVVEMRWLDHHSQLSRHQQQSHP